MKRTPSDVNLINYFNDDNGYVFYYGEAGAFYKLLRVAIARYLGISHDKLIYVNSESDFYGKLKRFESKNIVLILDAVYSNSYMVSLLSTLSNNYSHIKPIIITNETHKNILALYHELGAKNFIMKPVSINTIIEKISNTIKPHGELSKLIEEAKMNLEICRPEHAKKIAFKILEQKPNSPTGNIILGDVELYHNNNIDKAIEYFELAHKSSVLYLEPIKKLAEAYQRKGDASKTLKYLNKLERLSPLNTYRKIEIGKINLDIGNEELAESYFNEAIKIAAQDAINEIVILVKKIAEITERKNPELSIKFYNKAIAYRNESYSISDIDIFNKLGLAYRAKGKWRDAIREYEKALTVKHNDEGIYYNIAMAYAEGGEFKNSVKFLEKSLSINQKLGEGNKNVLKNIFIIFKKCSKIDSAEYYALKVKELDQNDKDVNKFLSR